MILLTSHWYFFLIHRFEVIIYLTSFMLPNILLFNNSSFSQWKWKRVVFLFPFFPLLLQWTDVSPSRSESAHPHTIAFRCARPCVCASTHTRSSSSSSPVFFVLAEGAEAGHPDFSSASFAPMQLTPRVGPEKGTWRNSWLIQSNSSMVCEPGTRVTANDDCAIVSAGFGKMFNKPVNMHRLTCNSAVHRSKYWLLRLI